MSVKYKRSARVTEIYNMIVRYMQRMKEVGKTPTQITVTASDYEKLLADKKKMDELDGLHPDLTNDLEYGGIAIKPQ